MLFDPTHIASFAPYPGSVQNAEGQAWSDLDVANSNGDLVREFSIWRDQKKLEGIRILFPNPIAYAVTLGDAISQTFVDRIRTDRAAPSLIYEVTHSAYLQSYLLAEPAIESLVQQNLRHLVVPSDDSWLHVLLDGTPLLLDDDSHLAVGNSKVQLQ